MIKIMHILFNEQTVYEKGIKWKKVYLTSVGNLASVLPFPGRDRDNIFSV